MTVIDMDRINRQTAEFDALATLVRAFNALPAVVDDDYPEMRHMYESRLRTFIDALEANGRVRRVTGEITLHIYSPDPQAMGDCRICGQDRDKPWHRYTRYRIERDGFEGVVIGDYMTLEGIEGVVLQQSGSRVVHVYQRKSLLPARE